MFVQKIFPENDTYFLNIVCLKPFENFRTQKFGNSLNRSVSPVLIYLFDKITFQLAQILVKTFTFLFIFVISFRKTNSKKYLVRIVHSADTELYPSTLNIDPSHQKNGDVH